MASLHRKKDPMFCLDRVREGDSTIGHLSEFLGGFEDEPPFDVVFLMRGAMEREVKLGL